MQAALKARPDYFDAQYNLGFALAQQNDFGAAAQFTFALQLQPRDAAVEANLGAALAEMGRYGEAKSHFEHALQLDPSQPIAKENLEALQKPGAAALVAGGSAPMKLDFLCSNLGYGSSRTDT